MCWPRLKSTHLSTLPLHPNLFKTSVFTPMQEILITLKSLLTTSSNTNQGQPPFCLALDGWPAKTLFGNLSSFIRRTCPVHLNFSLITARESLIEPHFSYSLLLEIRSVGQVPKTVRRQFLRKIKQFVVTNCSKERPGSIVTKTLKMEFWYQ